MEENQLVEITVRRMFGEDYQALIVFQNLQAFFDGLMKTNIGICRDKIKPTVKNPYKRRCDQTEQSGSKEIPVLFLVVIGIRKIFIYDM